MWRKQSRLLFLLLLLLLLTASTPASGGRTGEGDAINTGQVEEPPPPQGRSRPLPVTPLRAQTEVPRVNSLQGRAQLEGAAPTTPRASQSSTSLQFFHSSSFHHAQAGVSAGSASRGLRGHQGPSTTPAGVFYGHTEGGSILNLPPSAPLPPLRPLWPDPPPSTPPPTPPTASLPTLPVPKRISQPRQEAPNGRRKHRRVLKTTTGVTSGGRGRRFPAPRGDTPGGLGLSPGTLREAGRDRALRGQYKALWQDEGSRYMGLPEESAEDIEDPLGEALLTERLWNATERPARPSALHSEDNQNKKPARDFPSEWVVEGESIEEASEGLPDTQSRGAVVEGGGRDGGPPDTDHQEMTPFPGDSTEGGMNGTRVGGGPPVDLDALELELATKEEEATSDLLLAISILQHHDLASDEASDQALNATDGAGGRARPTTKTTRGRSRPTLPPRKETNKFNIEIFDTISPESEEVVGEVEEVGPPPEPQEVVRHDSRPPATASRYRWFVLVLDGNCSVIKQRMSAFVTFLKAALSSKLSVDYEDVFVPSVFCDKTFMVNISLDTLKNPEVERRLRTLAEANTTLLEISQEIFYLEKILTKRSSGEKQHVHAAVKKPDDMELVIYIAVGCMCVFILLSVVVVVLIRVCRQEGDHLDMGKPHLHHIIPRSLDFPIRRPNVIYSQRFSQALTPGKCGRQMEEEAPAGGGGVGSVAVVAVGAGRGSYLRYDPEIGGCGGDVYSIGALADDPYHDRRALVPARKRITHVPGEDVIIEEDLIEEEEEEEVEEEEDGEDEEEEEEVEDLRRRRRRHHLQEDEAEILGEHLHDEEEEEDESQIPPREQIRPITTTGSKGIVRTVLGKGRRAGDMCKARGAEGTGLGTGGKRGVFSGLDNPCYNR
ncbi:hypothetical protein O3P69_005016 [Scylla paramamosain]|uniref:Uncharacterized protein n=1 Tax=Scylla paramamosain TaxID=85552 RepID=A0AAW0U9H7_SCYPA